jgi:hypothetical protein
MIARRVGLALLLCAAMAPAAAAQTFVDAPRAGSWEVGGGVRWGGSTNFGERRAEQTRNPTTGSGPFELFTANSELEAASGGDLHLAFYVTPAVALEAGFRYAQPRLRVRLSADAEDAEVITAEETISQYQFDGSILLHFTNMSFAGGRAVPFVLGGAGHIRDLHQGDDLVETGTEFHAGGGLKWWFGSGRRRLGFRIEARATSREGGFSFGDERRTVGSGSISLAYLF